MYTSRPCRLEREIKFRDLDLRTHTEGDCVVPVLGWHLPAGESLFPQDRREHAEQALASDGGTSSTAAMTTSGALSSSRSTAMIQNTHFPYILVMKRGRESLHQAVQSRRFAGIDIAFVRRIAWRLASCLYGLHERGIIHGDVKPRNVLLYDDDKLVLCDLDTSAKKGTQRKEGEKMPSSGYSAPELERWRIWSALPESQRQTGLALEVTRALDIWSFGVVLFELCSGERLFHRKSFA